MTIIENDKHQQQAEDRIGSYNSNDRKDVGEIKNCAKNLIETISKHCPDGRRKSHAMTEVESAAMYAVKSLFEG